MRILLLTHSFNSLSQRLYAELTARDHHVSVELDISDAVTEDAVRLFRPDVIVAPFLKRAVPESVWRRCLCLIVHPGIRGDRGPSALDWAVLRQERRWGVTVLQAEAEMDAGPVWAWREFPMRNTRKSSLYRFEVTEAATAAVLEAIGRKSAGDWSPRPVDDHDTEVRGSWQDAMRQADRRIDWASDDTATVLRKIYSGDGNPGVVDEICGEAVRVFDAHAEEHLRGSPGALIAHRNDAVCRATVDGAIWLGRLRPIDADASTFKLPASRVLAAQIATLPENRLPLAAAASFSTYRDIAYVERDRVGYLTFDFYNGAMSTARCRRLLEAYRYAVSRPTRVIVLMGGADFFCNGLDLNLIEAAQSPADESWANINAMDDLAEAIINTTSHATIAALAGNAGAGGVFLALAADRVLVRDGVVLNPHYKNMGNLYGSEYWTYLLPKRVGRDGIEAVMGNRLPLLASNAVGMGLADYLGPGERHAFHAEATTLASDLANGAGFTRLLRIKRRSRREDEHRKPLRAYREQELARMRLNFYGFDPSYHVARFRFVHRTPHAWTPLFLAAHRRLGWQPPVSPATREAGGAVRIAS
ncbi:MAG: hydrogenase maturation protein [Woeseiaceae bacterium]|nr:hydrogenase maturation protein [Woeseiaceae bacterium]